MRERRACTAAHTASGYPAMGFVLLDVEFRTERAYKIRIPRGWPEQLGIRGGGDDATLKDMHEYLLRLCREQNVVPPEDSWLRLLDLIVDASGADIADLAPDTKLIRDIAPFG
jgi:hypothetical protein